MKKEQFLRELEDNLYGLPKEDIKEIMEDYKEHFKIGKKSKRKETEIAKSLGDPKKIAKEARKELLDDKESFSSDLLKVWVQIIIFVKQIWKYSINILKENSGKEVLKEGYKNLKKIIQLFFESKKLRLIFLNILIIPFWIFFFGVIISLILAGWAIILAGIISILVVVFSLSMSFALPVKNILLSGLYASFGIICFGIIFSILTWKPGKIFFRLLGRYLKWNKRCFMEKKNESKD